MQRSDVIGWVQEYERLWRSPGTDRLAALFTEDATYLPSPWAEPVRGLAGLAAFWESERDGPDEEFTLTYELVAVDGDTAVIRAEVRYADPVSGHWRDLWLVTFAEDGRCSEFEEWPFAPDQPDGH